MIKSGVKDVYRGEIQGCLPMLPQLADGCVIGVPDLV